MSAQNFNFAFTFPLNEDFLRQIMHFWTEIFRQKKYFLTIFSRRC